MKEYINKAVVAELERRINEYNTPIDRLGSNNIRLNECKDLLYFINTLEVKKENDMTEKENRIHSFALSFLERQQITSNFYADQIIRGYKEGYHQAEKDLEVKEVDLEKEFEKCCENYTFDDECEVYTARHFFELGLKAKENKL